MKQIKFLAFLLFSVLAFSACSDNDNDDPTIPQGKQDTNVLISKIEIDFKGEKKDALELFYDDQNNVTKVIEYAYDIDADINPYEKNTYEYVRNNNEVLVTKTYQDLEDGITKTAQSQIIFNEKKEIIKHIEKSSAIVTTEEITEYTWENGKLVKTKEHYSSHPDYITEYTFTYSGDNLVKKYNIKRSTYTTDYVEDEDIDTYGFNSGRFNIFSLLPIEATIVLDEYYTYSNYSLSKEEINEHKDSSLSKRVEISSKKILRQYENTITDKFAYIYGKYNLPEKLILSDSDYEKLIDNVKPEYNKESETFSERVVYFTYIPKK